MACAKTRQTCVRVPVNGTAESSSSPTYPSLNLRPVLPERVGLGKNENKRQGRVSDYIVNPIKIVPNVRIYLRDGTLYVVQTSNCVSTEKDFRKNMLN